MAWLRHGAYRRINVVVALLIIFGGIVSVIWLSRMNQRRTTSSLFPTFNEEVVTSATTLPEMLTTLQKQFPLPQHVEPTQDESVNVKEGTIVFLVGSDETFSSPAELAVELSSLCGSSLNVHSVHLISSNALQPKKLFAYLSLKYCFSLSIHPTSTFETLYTLIRASTASFTIVANGLYMLKYLTQISTSFNTMVVSGLIGSIYNQTHQFIVPGSSIHIPTRVDTLLNLFIFPSRILPYLPPISRIVPSYSLDHFEYALSFMIGQSPLSSFVVPNPLSSSPPSLPHYPLERSYPSLLSLRKRPIVVFLETTHVSRPVKNLIGAFVKRRRVSIVTKLNDEMEGKKEGSVRIHEGSLEKYVRDVDAHVIVRIGKRRSDGEGRGENEIIVDPMCEVDLTWVANLPVDAFMSWHKPRIEIHVITNNRAASLERLMTSLSNADYVGDNVSLTFHVEATADAPTINYVYSFNWEIGRKIIHRRTRLGGLLGAVTESWVPETLDDYAILLEDDIEVSPYFYHWAKYAILYYRYSAQPPHNQSHVFGISLYTPRIQEMSFPRRPLDPSKIIPHNAPFLFQVPCSWGAVYFPDHWKEFQTYLIHRLVHFPDVFGLSNSSSVLIPYSPAPKVVRIPGSRSNVWQQSWKKYYIEMIVLRGYVMVYPNFPDQASFSTNHLEPGAHISKTSNVRVKMMDGFRVPLIQRGTEVDGTGKEWRWTSVELRPVDKVEVLNLFAEKTSLDALVQYGKSLNEDVLQCQDSERIVRTVTGEVVCQKEDD